MTLKLKMQHSQKNHMQAKKRSELVYIFPFLCFQQLKYHSFIQFIHYHISPLIYFFPPPSQVLIKGRDKSSVTDNMWLHHITWRCHWRDTRTEWRHGAHTHTQPECLWKRPLFTFSRQIIASDRQAAQNEVKLILFMWHLQYVCVCERVCKKCQSGL